MNTYTNNKVVNHHLKRKALIYVRQSTMRQVMENTESTARQYALTEKAQELGWSQEQIEVIDDDLGKTASSAEHRNGFQKLVADVAMGQVGIVMGLEISRLARNNADFQQLLQICGNNNTLIYDADAIYDLMHLNDRIILGFKGTMSEAELFTITARLQGGALNKAARAELRIKLPVGFVYSPSGQVELDPDLQVQKTIRLFFDVFRRIGSSKGVVRHFNQENIKFPMRPLKGSDKGEITWRSLETGLALRILHNPRYAGAYAYGRTKVRKSPSGGVSYSKREREQWHALVKDVHPSYITWDEFEANEERITANTIRDFHSPVREGCALLQGIVICGRCGRNLATSYKYNNGKKRPVYLCNREYQNYGRSLCTSIPGTGIDEIITRVLLDKLTPVAVESALSVGREIVKRTQEADRLLQLHVQRAQYEADLARKRVMSVDPENRLVAQTLEKEWNEKLTLLEQAKLDYDKKSKANQNILDPLKQEKLKLITDDFATIWSHQATTYQDKKRMVRLLIEDVTLKRDDHDVEVYIRFKTGAVLKEHFWIPVSGKKPIEIEPEIIHKIDTWSSAHTPGEIAKKLNEQGLYHPTRGNFNIAAVVYLLKQYKIPTCYSRLRSKGYLSQEELAKHCGVKTQTIRRWKSNGWLTAARYNDQPEYLYEPKFSDLPAYISKQYPPLLSIN